jgi:hypothetical protein
MPISASLPDGQLLIFIWNISFVYQSHIYVNIFNYTQYVTCNRILHGELFRPPNVGHHQTITQENTEKLHVP